MLTIDGKLRFVQPRDDFHAIFGWLQEAEAHKINERTAKLLPKWARYHPHVLSPNSYDSNNTIYIASKNLCLDGIDFQIQGGGLFTPKLRLTIPEGPRSYWELPKWFFSDKKEQRLTYHKDLKRWTIKEDSTILRSVARGQEFVLDTSYYPEAI